MEWFLPPLFLERTSIDGYFNSIQIKNSHHNITNTFQSSGFKPSGMWHCGTGWVVPMFWRTTVLDCLTPKMKALWPLKHWNTTHPVSQHYIPENVKLHQQHFKRLTAPTLKLQFICSPLNLTYQRSMCKLIHTYIHEHCKRAVSSKREFSWHNSYE